MTLQDVKRELRLRGYSLSGWALAHGFHQKTVVSAIVQPAKPDSFAPVRDRILAALGETLKGPEGVEK